MSLTIRDLPETITQGPHPEEKDDKETLRREGNSRRGSCILYLGEIAQQRDGKSLSQGASKGSGGLGLSEPPRVF